MIPGKANWRNSKRPLTKETKDTMKIPKESEKNTKELNGTLKKVKTQKKFNEPL